MGRGRIGVSEMGIILTSFFRRSVFLFRRRVRRIALSLPDARERRILIVCRRRSEARPSSAGYVGRRFGTHLGDALEEEGKNEND